MEKAPAPIGRGRVSVLFLYGEVNRNLRNLPPLNPVLEVADGRRHFLLREFSTNAVARDGLEVFFDDDVDGLVHGRGEGK